MAPVASVERKKAGNILKARIGSTFSQEFIQSSPEMKDDRLRAKGIFQLTADYLIADQTCEASKKVRLYRGIGGQPAIRPGGSNNGLQLFGDINRQIYSSFSNLPQGTDIGVLAYEQMENLKIDFDAINWDLLLGVGRSPHIYEEEAIQGRWTYLASAHTLDSKGSPLISTSLLSTVGDQYGPPVLVLDICPERIFPAIMTFDVFSTFWESELYVPFFILPEEVVRIDGLPCFFERQKNPDHICPDILDRDPPSDMTKNFRRIFLNFGYRFERIFMSELISFIDSPSAGIELREPYEDNKNRFYKELDESQYELNQWRTRITHLKFEGSCEAAKKVVESGTSYISFLTEYEFYEEEPSPEEKKRLEEQSRVARHYLEQYKIDLFPICGAL